MRTTINMAPIRRAQLYVGNRQVTRVGDFTWLRTVDSSPVDRILVRETVEDPDNAYPHFLVEAFDDDGCAPPEWTQPPQGECEFDVFRICPVEVELGESRSVICSCSEGPSLKLAHATKPTPGSARVFLTTGGGRFNVTDAPLAEHETVSHGRIRIIKVVHDDAPKSFFVDAASGGDPAAIALLSALLTQSPAPGLLRELPVIELR